MSKKSSQKRSKTNKQKNKTLTQEMTVKQKLNQRNLQVQIQKFVQESKKKKIQKFIKNAVDKNRNRDYSESFNFLQRWQNDSRNRVQDKLFFWLKESSNLYFIINAFCLAIRMIVIWYASTRRIFAFYELDFIYQILIPTLLFDCLVNYLQSYFNTQNKTKQIWFQVSSNVYGLIYSFLVLSRLIDKSASLVIFDMAFIALQYNRCTKIYKLFHRILISSRFKNELNIIDLLFTLIRVGHVFTILIYLMVHLNPTQNWTSKIPVPLHTWLDRYIYSMYFAYTTMLTVGYGDLAPVNKAQIMTVLLVQVLGVVTFAYVINEIGNTLSEMRQKNEKIDHNLGMIERLSEYYSLRKEVTIKAKDYVMDNKPSQNEISIQQENNLLNSLNDELRDQITNETNTKLMRKSLFFICNWTKVFQNQIAKQLTKKIFCPNEKLYSGNNDQIFVIHKGVLNIFAEREHRGKTVLRKQIKSMNSNSQDEVLRNVFGYSKALTNKPVRLSAQAEKSVIAYVLENKTFLEVIKQQNSDFEYYCEMKQKLQLLKLPESFEAPEILSQKHHYFPSLRKIIYNLKKTYQRQTRKQFIRKQRKFDLVLDEEIKQIFFETVNKSNVEKQVGAQFQKDDRVEDTFQQQRQYCNYFKRNNLKDILAQMENRNYSFPKKNHKKKPKS